MSTPATVTGAEMGLLSYLFEAVGDLLTDEQRAALTTQLTSLRPAGVAPGDLITAELFNGMLNNVNDLLARVAVLEGAEGGPVIERIEPEGVDKQIGRQIIIVGRNFAPDSIDTSVSIGAIKVTDFFLESDSQRLILPVPVGFTTLPVTVPVTVTSGGKTSNSLSVRIVEPQVVATGSIEVSRTADPIGTITIGGTNTIRFKVKSQLNVTRDFELTTQVFNVQGSTAQAWLDEARLSETAPIRLASGEERIVTMTVKVPTGATSIDIRLHAATTDDSFRGNSPMIPLVVGAAPAVSDTRAQVSQRTFDDPDEDLVFESILINGNTVAGFKLRPSKTTFLPMRISTIADGGGFYRFEVTVEGETARWQFQTPAAAPLNIAENQNQPIDLTITSSNKNDTTTVSFLTITAKCFASSGSATPRFTSFKRIPIIGKN
jgi:IPT/TIG domain